MSKASRLERLDNQRIEREAEYLQALIQSLQVAAAGSWGLFEHKPDRSSRAKWKDAVSILCNLGQEIDEMRVVLGMEPFELHEQFEASRGPVSSTAPGEPKQAAQWLAKLGQPIS